MNRILCQYVCIDILLGLQDTLAMAQSSKSAQLQIRVTHAEKKAIQRGAKLAGLDMSAYVLSRVLPASGLRFQECVATCAEAVVPSYALAELNSFLSALTPGEMSGAVEIAPSVALKPFLANYIAAMVEYGCARVCIASPPWTRSVLPLQEPAFASTLQSLRLHLLTHSPPPFRRRNIFIDSSLGQRV